MMFFGLALFFILIFPSSSPGLEIPVLNPTINDFAGMMPRASINDLEKRLKTFTAQTGDIVVVVTISSLENKDLESLGRKAFNSLPLTADELGKTVLLLVARKEQKVGVQIGGELGSLFPLPPAQEKLQAQVEPYLNGMRPDLGIHAAVHYIFGVIRGDFRIDTATEAEQLENASKRGAAAGAFFSILLAPYLAFVAGMLWGVYATHYGVQRETRLFIGAVLGGGTAKIVAMLMSLMGHYSDGLWYFILALSIPLAVFASLTEYWMAGETADWCAIPRVKDKVKRKPEDNMGI
jgi:uncharacterized protein